MNPAQQAAIDYLHDAMFADPVQAAKSLEIAEAYFEHVPEAERREAITQAAAKAVGDDLTREPTYPNFRKNRT